MATNRSIFRNVSHKEGGELEEREGNHGVQEEEPPQDSKAKQESSTFGTGKMTGGRGA